VFVQVCSAHGFSKAAAKLVLLEPFAETVARGHELIKIIKNRDRLRSALLAAQLGVPLVLLKFCETRFAYLIISLQRLLKLKNDILSLIPLFQ